MRRFLWLVLVITVCPLEFARASTPRETLLISPSWLAQHLADPNVVLLQVGDRAEYDARHIAGTRFADVRELSVSDRSSPTGLNLELPQPEMLRTALSSLGISDRSIVVVTYSERALLSATRTMLTLDYAGFGHTSSLLNGGTAAWVAEGRATTTVVPAAKPGLLSPLKIRSLTVTADDVNGKIGAAGDGGVGILASRMADTPRLYSLIDNGRSITCE